MRQIAGERRKRRLDELPLRLLKGLEPFTKRKGGLRHAFIRFSGALDRQRWGKDRFLLEEQCPLQDVPQPASPFIKDGRHGVVPFPLRELLIQNDDVDLPAGADRESVGARVCVNNSSRSLSR